MKLKKLQNYWGSKWRNRRKKSYPDKHACNCYLCVGRLEERHLKRTRVRAKYFKYPKKQLEEE